VGRAILARMTGQRREPAVGGRSADFLARMDRYLADGPPEPGRRVTREEFRAQLGS
jgi:hypothetical protein